MLKNSKHQIPWWESKKVHVVTSSEGSLNRISTPVMRVARDYKLMVSHSCATLISKMPGHTLSNGNAYPFSWTRRLQALAHSTHWQGTKTLAWKRIGSRRSGILSA